MSKDYTIGIYIRLSLADEDTGYGNKAESDSIGNQRMLINRYLDNHPVLRNFPRLEFADDGYTGTNFNRPQFTAMMEKVRRSEINLIIVKDFSRFSRDYIETGNYLECTFPFMGVRFISINDGYDSDTPENLGKLAEGSNTLEMLIKGEKSQIKQALEGIEGVNSVTIEKDEKQNLWSAKVSTEEQNDIREKVFYKMAEINSPIYEMKSKKVSLEEIFLELTASDKPVSADDKNTDAGKSDETIVKQTAAETSEQQNNDKGGEK